MSAQEIFHGYLVEITAAALRNASTEEYEALRQRIVTAAQTDELAPMMAFLLLSAIAINRTDREA